LFPMPDGSLYVGTGDNNTPWASSITKFNADLSVAWTKGQTNSTGATNQGAIDIDSSGNITVSRYAYNTSSSTAVVRLNSSGTYVWDSIMGSGSALAPGVVQTVPSGNVYVFPYNAYNNSGNRWYVFKYNSSGTIQWQRNLNGTGYTYSDQASGVVAPSSESLYSTGAYSSNGSTVFHGLAKWNSSGTLQWSRSVTGITAYTGANSVALDSSENVYTTFGGLITKLDSTGAQLWQRSLSGTGLGSNSPAIAVDPSGNVFISYGSSANGLYILKYNSSGTLQWQRLLSSGTVGLYGSNGINLKADSSAVYFSSSDATSQAYFFKLPSDGSLTGTYTLGSNNWTWASSSLTDSAGSYSYTNPSWTDTAGSATITNTGGLTQNTYTYTPTTKTIP
jgi:hypothetical protein